MPTFEDEDLPVATKTTTATAAVETSDDLDVDFGDTDAMSTTDGLEKIQPADKSSKVRTAVLTDVVKPKMAWMHFIQVGDKKQSYRCLSKRDKKHVVTEMGDCCKKLNNDDNQKAQLNFAVLGIKYINADPKTGKYEKDAKTGEVPAIRWELGWIKLSRSGFKSVSELVMEGEKPEDFDFTIGNRDNGIGYTYGRVSQKARYRLNPDLLAEIHEEAKKFADGVLLTKRLGKVITPLEMRAVLAGKAAASGSTGGKQIDNTDDL